MGGLDVGHGGLGADAEHGHEVDGVCGVAGFVERASARRAADLAAVDAGPEESLRRRVTYLAHYGWYQSLHVSIFGRRNERATFIHEPDTPLPDYAEARQRCPGHEP